MAAIDVRHDGLGRFRRLTAASRDAAEAEARALAHLWDTQWARRQAIERHADPALLDALKRLEAEEASEEAARAIAALTAILPGALRARHAVDWSPLYDRSAFAEPPPAEPVALPRDPEPLPSEFKRAPLTLRTLISPARMRARREAAETAHREAHEAWEKLTCAKAVEHAAAVAAWRAAFAGWERRKSAFLDLQARTNARIDALRAGYARKEPEAVVGHCDLLLLALARPAGFPAFWTMTFAHGVLGIEYDLPSTAAVPVVESVRYVPARGAFDTVVLSEAERERRYCRAVFETCLAALHALYAGDEAGAIKSVAFNGWVNYLDAAGGRPGRACALTVTAEKSAFAALDLAGTDPESAFRALNGTMSARLAAMAARVPSP